jgi:small neutral amino acid transporter SnatA (MarC family)
MKTVVLLLLAVDPVGIAVVWPRRGWLLAAALLGGSAVLADPVLDVLDLSPEAFWVAAGVLLLVPAFPLLGTGDHREAVGPAAIAVTMAYATRDGTAETLLGVAVVTVAVLLAAIRTPTNRWLGRAMGAAMIVLALDLVRDGVIAV